MNLGGTFRNPSNRRDTAHQLKYVRRGAEILGHASGLGNSALGELYRVIWPLFGLFGLLRLLGRPSLVSLCAFHRFLYRFVHGHAGHMSISFFVMVEFLQADYTDGTHFKYNLI